MSVRTNRLLANPSFSAIREHAHTHDHPFSSIDFSILQVASTQVDTKLWESLYIKQLQPELNNQFTSSQLHLIQKTWFTQSFDLGSGSYKFVS